MNPNGIQWNGRDSIRFDSHWHTACSLLRSQEPFRDKEYRIFVGVRTHSLATPNGISEVRCFVAERPPVASIPPQRSINRREREREKERKKERKRGKTSRSRMPRTLSGSSLATSGRSPNGAVPRPRARRWFLGFCLAPILVCQLRMVRTVYDRERSQLLEHLRRTNENDPYLPPHERQDSRQRSVAAAPRSGSETAAAEPIEQAAFHEPATERRVSSGSTPPSASLSLSMSTPPSASLSSRAGPTSPLAVPSSSLSKGKVFAPCPEESRKLVWFRRPPNRKLYEPAYRAFHSRGWSVTRDISRAHVLWADQPSGFFDDGLLEPWQRFNQFPGTHLWDDKDLLALTMARYYHSGGDATTETREPEASLGRRRTPLHSFPESYVLHLPEGMEAFRDRLREENGGLDVPWVLKKPTSNKGKGVTILAPRSEALMRLVGRIEKQREEFSARAGERRRARTIEDGDRLGGEEGFPTHGDTEGSYGEADEDEDEDEETPERLVVQKYICDEMTYEHRKFDVRVYWTVASVDPLIALVHTRQNYVRVGHAVYDESNFSHSTRTHLTTHTFASTETKATWDEFREHIERHVWDPGSNHGHRFRTSGGVAAGKNQTALSSTLEAIQTDPFRHVQNQMNTAIAHLVDAYRGLTFHGRSIPGENGFSWHAADMIVDNNLDVYVIEGTDGPGKDEDYDFRIAMHDELLGSVVDILEEIVGRQEEGRPLDVAEMAASGVFGGYEVVYDDGRMLDYRYERLPQKGCGAAEGKPPKHDGKGDASAVPSSFPKRTIVPASFRALPKKKHESGGSYSDKTKTFWMHSRTRRTCEPVARSLRRNGWTPVDRPEEAQLVYLLDKDEDYDPLAWQFVNYLPSQDSFFELEYLKHLDSTSVPSVGESEEEDKSGVCRPIVHQGQRIQVQVYWLVLSLDPLTVLYHDGYVEFMYSTEYENEFLALPITDKDGRPAVKRAWRGSWSALEHYVNTTHANLVSISQQTGNSRPNSPELAATRIRSDPASHVKNQMKQALVLMAKGLHTNANQSTKSGSSSPTHSSFALFSALFEIDQNLNVFFKDSYPYDVRGEVFSDIVNLHDDVYGSAFQLLEHFNGTTMEIFHPPSGTLMGRYEWLAHASSPQSGISNKRRKSNQNKRLWEFHYDWRHKAKTCVE